MKTLTLALTILSLSSCGSDFNPGGAKPTKADEDSPQSEGPKSAKSQPMSMALESKDDLPECAKENDRQLIYLLDEGLFYSCNKKEWVVIDVHPELKDSNYFHYRGEKYFAVGEFSSFSADKCPAWMQEVSGPALRVVVKEYKKFDPGYALARFWYSASEHLLAYNDSLSTSISAKAHLLCKVK